MGNLPKSIAQLLDTWLNVVKNNRVILVHAPDYFRVRVPEIGPNETVTYCVRNLNFGPGAYLPFASVDQERREVNSWWPPEGSLWPVSPEAESALRFSLTKTDGGSVVTKEGDRALPVLLRYPQPLDQIMPKLSSLDDLHSQAQMVRVASLTSTNYQEALRMAELGAQPHTFTGSATVQHSMIGKGVAHLLFQAEDQGLEVPRDWHASPPSIDELFKSEGWREWLESMVPTRRIWGATGLFWTLLLDSLQDGRSFASCDNCGRVFSGKRGKRFCGSQDDPQCFRNRRAGDQRRSRIGRRS